ncbi:substrate-binding domain-containing protein [Chelatococcus daeguensis]|uniref:extracellular solute-binding protein n=1 Tax=Chelatococcus daeguensis TaxID=444444 RepID=UPI0009EE0CC8|nr:extracellular solute-binding protein [Chelatococcus daeguensis]MBM3083473.1 substrate-binding domain-containing protein [Chelatococcus daeguensis]
MTMRLFETTRRAVIAAAVGAAIWGFAAPAGAQTAERPFITVASTTSTEQSGLFKHLLPQFTGKTGIEVRVVAVGTGQALKIGERGDADLVFVHARSAEEDFVAKGFGVGRSDVMYNDFVLVGPKSDPAGVKGSRDAVKALQAIALKKAPFVSRGDDSGTHQAELELWQRAALHPKADGNWYRETGSGMGPALNTAAAMDAYILADRGTWLSFKNRGDLTLLVEGDDRLFNQYGIILVNPARHAHVKEKEARTFINWVISPEGQAAIAAYRIEGEQLFFPNARRKGA